MALRPAVFLDRDGTLNVQVVRDGKPYAPERLEDFRLFDGVPEACRALKAAGFVLVVATNQPDVGRGDACARRPSTGSMHACCSADPRDRPDRGLLRPRTAARNPSAASPSPECSWTPPRPSGSTSPSPGWSATAGATSNAAGAPASGRSSSTSGTAEETQVRARLHGQELPRGGVRHPRDGGWRPGNCLISLPDSQP